MPISVNITQPSGVVATFHMVMNEQAENAAVVTGNCIVNSYLSDPRTSGIAPLATAQYDIGPMLNSPASVITPPAGGTIAQVIAGMIEQYLIAQQTAAPLQPLNPDGTTPTPLPPINGVFYGGTQVS